MYKKRKELTETNLPPLVVKNAADKGYGVFTEADIARRSLVTYLTGFVLPAHKVRADYMALQIDHDIWLCSKGGRLDDMINHSCRPNTGFTDGGLRLFALRDIAAGEEITFDYSTAIMYEEWSLECLCGESVCRKNILPFHRSGRHYVRENLDIALDYIRKYFAHINRNVYDHVQYAS